MTPSPICNTHSRHRSENTLGGRPLNENPLEESDSNGTTEPELAPKPPHPAWGIYAPTAYVNT